MTNSTSCGASVLLSQQKLNSFYLRKLGRPEHCFQAPELPEIIQVAEIESAWMTKEAIRCNLSDVPTRPAEFIDWYRVLFKRAVAQAEVFFDHLAHRASIAELSLYICFEEQVDGRFDDVIALAQLGLEGQAKLALARNYWEEMGEGVREQMHTYLFNESAGYFREALVGSPFESQLTITAEAIKNGNILLLMALNRRYSLRLLGALTLLEHTAPHRFTKAVQGMRRLAVPESIVYYHDLHIRVDAKHGDDLLNEIIIPLVSREPSLIPEIAIGMLIRFNIAADYYNGLASRMKITEDLNELLSNGPEEAVTLQGL